MMKMSVADQLSDNVSEPSLFKRDSEQTRAGYELTLSPTKLDRALVEETKSCRSFKISTPDKVKADYSSSKP